MKKVEESGLQVVGISYDAVADLKKFAEAKKITYPLLSDPGGKINKQYKLRNERAKGGLALPATIVIDTKQVVRANLAGSTFRRHSIDDLLKAAKTVKAEKPK